jgi:hypothetical protein
MIKFGLKIFFCLENVSDDAELERLQDLAKLVSGIKETRF